MFNEIDQKRPAASIGFLPQTAFGRAAVPSLFEVHPGVHYDSGQGAPHGLLAEGESSAPHMMQLASASKRWGPDGLLDSAKAAPRKAFLAVHPKLRGNFIATVNGLTNGRFSGKELETIAGEVLQDTSWEQGALFADPIPADRGSMIFTPKQWDAIQDVMRKLPEDELGKRVRSAYGDAVKTGRIRVRR